MYVCTVHCRAVSIDSAELNDWLKSKGRTPSKFRHLMCFHAEKSAETSNDPLTKNALSVDELNEQVTEYNRMLINCLKFRSIIEYSTLHRVKSLESSWWK